MHHSYTYDTWFLNDMLLYYMLQAPRLVHSNYSSVILQSSVKICYNVIRQKWYN